MVRNDDYSSRGTWKYPLTISRLAKHFTEAGMNCSMSLVLGKGCTGRSMYFLSGEKSVTGRILLFNFWTKSA